MNLFLKKAFQFTFVHYVYIHVWKLALLFLPVFVGTGLKTTVNQQNSVEPATAMCSTLPVCLCTTKTKWGPTCEKTLLCSSATGLKHHRAPLRKVLQCQEWAQLTSSAKLVKEMLETCQTRWTIPDWFCVTPVRYSFLITSLNDYILTEHLQ